LHERLEPSHPIPQHGGNEPGIKGIAARDGVLANQRNPLGTGKSKCPGGSKLLNFGESLLTGQGGADPTAIGDTRIGLGEHLEAYTERCASLLSAVKEKT
jgi:hypothetical protein